MISCGSKEIKITCNGEKLAVNNEKFLQTNGSLLVQGGELRTNFAQFSGEYSIRLNQANPYGFTISLPNYKGQKITVSVWKKGVGGSIVVSGDKGFYKTFQRVVEKNKGWKKIEESFIGPENTDSIKIYVYHPYDADVYFDDFSIVVLGKTETYPVYPKSKSLMITLTDQSLEHLNKKRKLALEREVLVTDKDSWVEANFKYQGNHYTGKIRLKGDWTDHLMEPKCSFRVKLAEGKINEVDEFSLQHPRTRIYFNEWVYHKFLEKEHVLTTNYTFLPVYLNNQSLGLYTFEEHFDDDLLLNKKYELGPIFKFDETGFWELQQYQKAYDTTVSFVYPFFDASTILPFNKNKTATDIKSKQLFEEARDKVSAYKMGGLSFSEVFDCDKYAKFYALSDLFEAYHGLVWHNLRFYYNPTSKKVEPIVYDATIYDFKISHRPILSDNNSEYFKTIYRTEEWFIWNAFNDSAFRSKYFFYLDIYSKIDLEAFFRSIQEEFDQVKDLMHQEFEYELYNKNRLFSRQKQIRDHFDTIKYKETDRWFNYMSMETYKNNHPNDANIPKINQLTRPFKGLGVKVYTNSLSNNSKELELINFHGYEATVMGYGISKNDTSTVASFILPFYTENSGARPSKMTVPANTKGIWVKYQSGEIIFESINPWTFPLYGK